MKRGQFLFDVLLACGGDEKGGQESRGGDCGNQVQPLHGTQDRPGLQQGIENRECSKGPDQNDCRAAEGKVRGQEIEQGACSEKYEPSRMASESLRDKAAGKKTRGDGKHQREKSAGMV